MEKNASREEIRIRMIYVVLYDSANYHLPVLTQIQKCIAFRCCFRSVLFFLSFVLMWYRACYVFFPAPLFSFFSLYVQMRFSMWICLCIWSLRKNIYNFFVLFFFSLKKFNSFSSSFFCLRIVVSFILLLLFLRTV